MGVTPIIGVTVDSTEGNSDNDEAPKFFIKKVYIEAVIKAGGLPLMISVAPQRAIVNKYLSLIDGLLISGGAFDVDPALFGEAPLPQLGALKPERTKMEIALYKKARSLGMPVLGVCGGEQLICVAHGGTLIQDIATQNLGAARHEQKPVPNDKATHTVTVAAGSLLSKIVNRPVIKVNSTHHQAVRDPGHNLTATGHGPDGIVEAIEPIDKKAPYLLGVQWHPEALYDHDEASVAIYKSFIAASNKYHRSKQ